MRNPITRLGALALAGTLTLAACSGSGSGPDAGGGGGTDDAGRPLDGRTVVKAADLTFASTLRAGTDCSTLLARIKAEAAAHVGPYGLTGSTGYGIAMPTGALVDGPMLRSAGGARDDAASASAGEASSGPAVSGTNVAEPGVDEADLVKATATRIVSLVGTTLTVVDTTGTPRVAGTLDLSVVEPRSLLVAGDRVLVFGGGGGYDRYGGGPLVDRPADRARVTSPGSSGTVDTIPAPALPTGATVTEIDLSTPSKPKRVRTVEVDGTFVDARQVGTVARIVVRTGVPDLGFVAPQSPAGEQRATEANRAVIAGSRLADWLPQFRTLAIDGTAGEATTLTPCERVDQPTEFAGFGSTSVLTVDLAKPLGDLAATTILADTTTVYASADTLYVAAPSWVDLAELEKQPSLAATLEQRYATSIHAFTLDGASPATYAASGSVPGALTNDLSLSAYKGDLRVATTKGSPWSSAGSESLVTVLRRDGGTLRRIGQVGGLGRNERIYGVRFVGPVGYVVTFRQTDPLYTIDLADPTAPKVVGELKIPGYSAYLHPVGDGLVLGVGQDATDQGRRLGTKVSLFDVHDLAAPREVATWTLKGTATQAEWDRHAFLWWPATRTVVLPVGPTAVVLRVGDTTITEVGTITSDDSRSRPPGTFATSITRTLVSGPNLWSLDGVGLQANDLASLATVARLVP
jgi:hypothetical protein